MHHGTKMPRRHPLQCFPQQERLRTMGAVPLWLWDWWGHNGTLKIHQKSSKYHCSWGYCRELYYIPKLLTTEIREPWKKPGRDRSPSGGARGYGTMGCVALAVHRRGGSNLDSGDHKSLVDLVFEHIVLFLGCKIWTYIYTCGHLI